MGISRGQGAIELFCRTTAGALHGQGATEYLVLLAVVLVIALVGIALLGFFPGTASDAQVAESKLYWQSASPITITEWAAKYQDSDGAKPYLRVRNNGAYPLRITKLLAPGTAVSATLFCSVGCSNISDYYYLGPGEEKYFGYKPFFPELPSNMDIGVAKSQDTGNRHYIHGATYTCNPSTSSDRGLVAVNDFGFEYVQYVEGQQITKRQIGTKPLMIKCS